MRMVEPKICGGVLEYAGLQDTAKRSLLSMYSEYKKWREEHPEKLIHTLLFSDPVKYDKGRQLRNHIIARGLGAVKTTDVRVNPNSHNPLEVFLFVPNWNELEKWYKTDGKPEKAKMDEEEAERRRRYSY